MFREFMYFSRILKKLRTQLLPYICALCGQPAQSDYMICEACQNDLPILSHSCEICAQILLPYSQNVRICGACLKQKPHFDKVYALFPYQPPISSLIIQLKFQHNLYIAKVFGKLLSEHIQWKWYRTTPLPHLIIPVPLHKERLSERGFNQALEIAKVTAKSLKIPIDYTGTRRIKATIAQSGLSAYKRKLNITNAFSVERDYNGLFIAVIDDVMTTGHTANALCAQLRSHGAKKIDIWCVARRE